MAKKASLPARAIWSHQTYRDLKAVLHEHRPDVVHVHNTFPLLSASVLYACRDARVPVVATIHNYKLACANGSFFRDGAVCHDCAGGLPVRAVLHGCYRGSRAATAPVALAMGVHRQGWRSLVSAYIFISASQRDLLRGSGFAPERVFVKYNLIPRRSRPQAARTPTVVYAGRLDEAKGVRLLMAGWDYYLGKAGEPGLNLVIVGGGPLERRGGGLGVGPAFGRNDRDGQRRPVHRSHVACARGPAAVSLGGNVRSRGRRGYGGGRPPIAAGHGSFTELITSGIDGVLFSPVIRPLWARHCRYRGEPRAIRGYGDQARKTYEQRFDPQRSVEELLEIYRFAITHPV